MQALGDCRDLTFDECGGDAPFDTLKNIGEAACQVIFFLNFNFEKKIGKNHFNFFSQLYCSGVYEGQCTFFIYDRKQSLCELFDAEVEDYAGSCNRLGGTPSPNLASCQDSDDECLVRPLNL